MQIALSQQLEKNGLTFSCAIYTDYYKKTGSDGSEYPAVRTGSFNCKCISANFAYGGKVYSMDSFDGKLRAAFDGVTVNSVKIRAEFTGTILGDPNIIDFCFEPNEEKGNSVRSLKKDVDITGNVAVKEICSLGGIDQLQNRIRELQEEVTKSATEKTEQNQSSQVSENTNNGTNQVVNENQDKIDKVTIRNQKKELIAQSQFLGTEKYFDGTTQGSINTFATGLGSNLALGNGAGMGDMIVGGAGLLIGALNSAAERRKIEEEKSRQLNEERKQLHRKNLFVEYHQSLQKSQITALSGLYYKQSTDGNYAVHIVDHENVIVYDNSNKTSYKHVFDPSGMLRYTSHYGYQWVEWNSYFLGKCLYGIEFDEKNLLVNLPSFAKVGGKTVWQISLTSNKKEVVKAPYKLDACPFCFGSTLNDEQYERVPGTEVYRQVNVLDILEGTRDGNLYRVNGNPVSLIEKQSKYMAGMYWLADRNLVFGFIGTSTGLVPFLTKKDGIQDFQKNFREGNTGSTRFYSNLPSKDKMDIASVRFARYHYEPEQNLLWCFLEKNILVLNLTTYTIRMIPTRFTYNAQVIFNKENNFIQISGMDDYYNPLIKIYNYSVLLDEITNLINPETTVYKAVADTFEENYNSENYEAIFESFSSEMKDVLPLDKTKEFFSGLKKQSGKIINREFLKYEQSFALYKTNFERSLFTIKISIDNNSRVNGIFVLP